MAQARFKDLVCVCIDVGKHAGEATPQWTDVLQRMLATRMLNERPHLEVAIMLYGSNNTNNTLWSAEDPDSYAGVDIVMEFAPCSIEFFQKLPQRLVAGTNPSDHFFALTAAADLLKRTVTARKLGAARKSIVFASPFIDSVPVIPDDQLVAIVNSLAADGCPSISAAVSAWVPAVNAEQQAARAAALREFQKIHECGAMGAVEMHSSPQDLFSLVRAHSAPTQTKNVLKIGEFEVNVTTCKLTGMDKLPTFKPYVGSGATPGESNFYQKETEHHIKGDSSRTVDGQARQKMFRFGKEHFPAQESDYYQWKSGSEEANFKGIQIIAFVKDTLTGTGKANENEGEEDEEEEDDEPPAAIPRIALIDTLNLVFPATPVATTTVSAMARAMQREKKVALVRYVLTAASGISLGVLVPRPCAAVPGASGQRWPDHFLLGKVAWGDDYQRLQLPSMQTAAIQVALDDEPIAAMTSFVRSRLAAPRPSATVGKEDDKLSEGAPVAAPLFPSDTCCDPMRARLVQHVAEKSAEAAAAGGAVTGEEQAAGTLRDDAMSAGVLVPSAQLEARSAGDAAAVRRALPGLPFDGDDVLAAADVAVAKKGEDAALAIKEERFTQPTV